MKPIRNPSLRSRLRSSLPALIFLLFGSCALTEDHINVGYVPQSGIAKLSQAEGTVVRVEVDDQRASKSHVGHKVNGYGMDMAQIIADNDISQVVKGAVQSELTDRGFTLGSDGTLINVVLGKFENHFELGAFSGTAVSEVSMLVTVKRPDGQIAYTKSIHAEGVNSGLQLASGENAKDALEAGLRDAVKKLFDDQNFLNSLSSSPKE